MMSVYSVRYKIDPERKAKKRLPRYLTFMFSPSGDGGKLMASKTTSGKKSEVKPLESYGVSIEVVNGCAVVTVPSPDKTSKRSGLNS